MEKATLSVGGDDVTIGWWTATSPPPVGRYEYVAHLYGANGHGYELSLAFVDGKMVGNFVVDPGSETGLAAVQAAGLKAFEAEQGTVRKATFPRKYMPLLEAPFEWNASLVTEASACPGAEDSVPYAP